jgi:hypothetical protein
MFCPQCSYKLIETESAKEYSGDLGGARGAYSPLSSVAAQSHVGVLGYIPSPTLSGQYLVSGSSGVNYVSPPTEKVFNCPKCHIAIRIDDDKKSKEKKDLMRIIEAFIDQRKRCEDLVKMFNNRWDDKQSIEKIEAMLVLK